MRPTHMADRRSLTRDRVPLEHVRAPVLLTVFLIALAVPDWLSEFSGGRGTGYAQPIHKSHAPHTPPGIETIRRWNEIAVDASGLDHTPVSPGDPRVAGEQFGPTRASRAMAIVHIAMFDSVNAIVGGYQSYTGVGSAPQGTAMEAAIAQAAHDTLIALFVSQAAAFDALLDEDLANIDDLSGRANGVDLGQRVAAAILALRVGDGSEVPDPHVGLDFFTSTEPGKWRMDPISRQTIALGAYWGAVTPFVMTVPNQFRVPDPPDLSSQEYAAAFKTVKKVGGDGVVTKTTRTAEQSEIGMYWAYDGTPSLCAPPRLYNQITVQIADQMGTTRKPLEFARLLALVNVAMADAGIAIWESKFFHNFWRPVTGVREADAATGPTGAGDGNAATHGDPTFSPLGAPASNSSHDLNFTPPFPSYPSGHAGFGGALFEILRRFYRTDAIAFTFVSDELNGVTLDNRGNVPPLAPRTFASLSEAEEEIGQSRIYLGIHWEFDKTAGIAQGRLVADYVFSHAFRPAGRGQ